MLKTKKSEMSIGLIVAAVIGLVLLVVVLAILGRGTGDAAKTLESCQSRGGICIPISECTGITIPYVECHSSTLKCCRTI